MRTRCDASIAASLAPAVEAKAPTANNNASVQPYGTRPASDFPLGIGTFTPAGKGTADAHHFNPIGTPLDRPKGEAEAEHVTPDNSGTRAVSNYKPNCWIACRR